MAKLSTLGGDGRFMVGEDKDITMEVLDRTTGLPVDVSGWTTSLVLTAEIASAALLTKAGSVTGSYVGTSRAANTQRLLFSLADTETETLTAGTYKWSIKRTDAGSERILGYGTCQIERANQT